MTFELALNANLKSSAIRSADASRIMESPSSKLISALLSISCLPKTTMTFGFCYRAFL